MLDPLLDPLFEIVVEPGDRLERAHVAVGNVAAGQIKGRSLGVQRHIRHREIIGHPGAVLRPVRVDGADGRDIDHVDIPDEIPDLIVQGLDVLEPLDGQVDWLSG
jgi:hypothetical protein